MILVVGATGLLGSEICRQLAAAGTPVRALVRSTSDPGKVAALRQLGAEIVQGDLRDPGSLVAACMGVEAVITTVSAMPFSYVPRVNDIDTTDREGARHLIDAAASCGVRHVVYTSFSGNLERECPLRDAKRATERRLIESGIDYTILRPSCFMEVWLGAAGGFDPVNAKATVYGTGEAPVSWIAIRDVAAFAIAALTQPAARNATLELGGPRPIPALEVVSIFETAFDRPFEVTQVPVEAIDAQVAAATDQLQRSFVTLMRAVADGDAIEMGRTSDLIDRPLTSVESYAAALRPTVATA